MVSMMDYLNLALRTFKHKPIRSWLTIIGIFIGIAAVVALISLGQGLQDAVNKQFEMINPNTIYVLPGSGLYGTLAAVVGSEKFTDHDINVIKRVSGIEKVVGFSTTLSGIEYGDEIKYAFVVGYDPGETNLSELNSVSLIAGRELKAGDKYRAIIGYNYYVGDVFKKKVSLNDNIKISNKTFTVVGVADRVGNPSEDKRIYIPLDTMKEMYGDTGYATIFAIVKDNYPIDTVAEKIKEQMRRDRGLKSGEEDFTVQTSEQLKESYENILLIVQIIVGGIAGISLLVGGIGIMNTMYTSVLERTREIGIMKTVGAKNSDIMMIFLMESGLLGLVGGILGIIIGVLISKGIETVTLQSQLPFSASYPWWLFVGALSFSFIIGCISGLVPALKAAKMKPADSIRY